MTYYDPSAEGGHLVPWGECGVAPPYAVATAPGPLRVTGYFDGKEIMMELRPAFPSRIAVDAGQIALTVDGHNQRVTQVSYARMNDRKRTPVPLSEGLDVVTERVNVYVEVPARSAEEVTLQFPAVLVDGVSLRVPAVKFRRKSGVYVRGVMLNC
jgi:hypothetical protein